MYHVQLSKEHFDVVIRMRFDSDIQNPESIFSEDLGGNICIPEGSNWNGINDQFAYGSIDTMNVYSSLFLNLNHLRKTPYYPEALLKNYLALTNLPVKRTSLVVKINGR
jgi:hypothetical protein